MSNLRSFDTSPDAPLMESEEIKGGDPPHTVTYMVSEASNPALARRHHEVNESVTMSHVSKEGVDDEEEEEEEEKERSFSQDLALLFFVEKQKWDTLSPNPVERERTALLERGQTDPENRTGLSAEESNLNIPDDDLQDCKNPSLNCHQGKHASSCSSSTHQYSLVHTTPVAQVLSAPSNATQGQVQIQALSVGFPQALNTYDTFPQAQREETVRTGSFPAQEESDDERPWLSHDTSCHQNAESSDPKSDEGQSVDAPHWMDERLSQEMEATWGTGGTPSEVEGAGTKQLNLLTTDNEKVRELNGLREDVKTSAPSQQCSGFSESSSINIDGIQATPGGTFSLPSSGRMDDNSEKEEEEKVECRRPNPLICTAFRFEEEDGTGEERAHLQMERMRRKHAKSNRSFGELGSAQKELPERVEPDPAEMQAQGLVDTELSEEEDLGWKEAESKTHTEQEKLALGHSNREEQEWDMQVQESFRKGAVPPFACGLNTFSNLENNLALPDLDKSGSLAETEGFSCPPQEVLSPDHCAGSMYGLLEPDVQTETAKSLPFAGSPEDPSPANDSPRTQSSKCHDSGQWEHSGNQNHMACVSHTGQDAEQSTEGGRKHYFEKEGSVNAGDGKRVVSFYGEGMTPSCKDLLGIPDPQDPNHSRPASHPVEAEIHTPGSLVKTTTAKSPLQEAAGKGDSNDTIGYVVLQEGPDPVQEPPNQDLPLPCQLDTEACGEVSVPNSVDVHTRCKNDTSSKDSHEELSDIPQSTAPGGRLPNIDKENGQLNLVSSMTEWDPASFQAQDPAMNYLEKYQQYLKPPLRNFVFPGKEVEAATLPTMQPTPTSESPCCLPFEEDRAECDCHTDSLASPSALESIATDVTQLTRPLPPVPDCDQTLTPEPASNHFSQPMLPMLECKQTVSFSTPPLNEDFLAQLPAPLPVPGLLLELPFPSQACSFSVLKPAAIEASQSSAPTPKLLDQSPTSETCSNEHSQLPDIVPNPDQSLSLEYDDHESLPKPTLLTKSKNVSVPALNANQLIQPPPFSQTREVTASELNTNLLAQVPVSALNTGLHNLPPASTKPPIPDGHQFAQKQGEAPESTLPINYVEDNEQIHTPIASFISQTTPSAPEPQSLAQSLNIDGRVEEAALGQLAKSEGASISQGPEDLNMYDASGNVEANLLGIHSDVIMLSKEPSHSIPEAMAKGTDLHDGKASSDHTSHPSTEGQKTPGAAEASESMHPTPLLAFTNPIHFLQLGPPSPPTSRHLCRPPASQGPQWWQQQHTGNAKTDASASVTRQQMEGGTSTFRKVSEKSVEAMAARVQRKERTVSHPPLEKSSSCPGKSVMRLDTKEPESDSKRQEGLPKVRTKSKDWHRQGVRKVSIPTDNALAEAIASLVPSKEEAHAHKGKPTYSEQCIYGEKQPAETVESIKRRHSKLINSSRLLYQEYSDVALNKAIQSQKRADSLSEDLELGSSSSPRLRRKVLSSQDSYLQRLSVSSSTSLWQDIPMIRGSTMLLSMTREEQKLQEAKFELIASEASYLRSLNIAVDHFQHSQELQAVLTNQDRQWLFSRLQDVRHVSAYFLSDLEEKFEENMFTFNVCDVALRHAPEFRRVYLPYVTNQTYQEQTFQRLLNGLPAFQQVLEKLESDPVCQRLSLKSFLILPFQRITRLKLLLQNILKRTQPGAAEEVQATQAYDALEKLIKDCNENVQRMKSTEELIYLSQNMEFECKIFPLISQSRHLIKRGELTALEYNMGLKWKLTTRPIYLHLFNDYLLLSRPRENGRFIVFDYAAFSDVRGEKCEMKLHGANKNVFRLFLLRNNQGKKVEFLFRTETQSEKLRWISALTPQQAGPDLLDDSDAPQVQCVKSYKARENDELALEKADIIMVLQQSSDGWIEGVKLSDGERGWFPSEQVEIISSKHARQMNLKEEQRVKYAKQQVFHRK